MVEFIETTTFSVAVISTDSMSATLILLGKSLVCSEGKSFPPPYNGSLILGLFSYKTCNISGKLFFFCVNVQGIQHIIHLTSHKTRKIVLAVVDAVICYPVLRIVVGADFF